MIKKYWLSWFEVGPHDYKGPWWTSGSSTQMNPVTYMFEEIKHCFAAVLAKNPYEAQSVIMNAHLGIRPNSFRFVEERPESWEPWSDRFPRLEGMLWPEPEGKSISQTMQSSPSPSQEPTSTASQ